MPPVDVLALAESFADVSEMFFPFDIDGLCLDLKRVGKRPKVWISRKLGYHRKRFTLAHEIGHIVIPWHTGSIVDELEADAAGARDDYRYMEGEANRFAAELLMPKHWAHSLCKRAEHMRDAMHVIAQRADVSLQAAALRTLQCGPPGYIVAATVDGIITWTGKTPGTRARAPIKGQLVGAVEMPAFEPPETLIYSSTEYHWWKTREKVPVPGKPTAPWRGILAGILLTIPVDERAKAQQQINAIVGLAIGKLPKGSSVDLIYQRALENLQNRQDYNPYLVALQRHPDFASYVLARAHERAETPTDESRQIDPAT